IRAGRSYTEPGVFAVRLGSDEHRVGFRRVHPTQHELYLGFAMGYHRFSGCSGELDAIQVFWPDSAGKFPFEVGCDLALPTPTAARSRIATARTAAVAAAVGNYNSELMMGVDWIPCRVEAGYTREEMCELVRNEARHFRTNGSSMATI